MLLAYPYTQLFKRSQMHIYRSRTKFAAAGIAQFASSRLAQHRAQKYYGTAHFAHKFLRYPVSIGTDRVGHRGIFPETAFATQFVKYPASGKNVRQLGTSPQHRPALRQQTPCKQRQRTVFGTLYPYLTAQPFSAIYDKSLHKLRPFLKYSLFYARNLLFVT